MTFSSRIFCCFIFNYYILLQLSLLTINPNRGSSSTTQKRCVIIFIARRSPSTAASLTSFHVQKSPTNPLGAARPRRPQACGSSSPHIFRVSALQESHFSRREPRACPSSLSYQKICPLENISEICSSCSEATNSRESRREELVGLSIKLIW